MFSYFLKRFSKVLSFMALLSVCSCLAFPSCSGTSNLRFVVFVFWPFPVHACYWHFQIGFPPLWNLEQGSPSLPCEAGFHVSCSCFYSWYLLLFFHNFEQLNCNSKRYLNWFFLRENKTWKCPLPFFLGSFISCMVCVTWA